MPDDLRHILDHARFMDRFIRVVMEEYPVWLGTERACMSTTARQRQSNGPPTPSLPHYFVTVNGTALTAGGSAMKSDHRLPIRPRATRRYLPTAFGAVHFGFFFRLILVRLQSQRIDSTLPRGGAT